MVFFAKLGLAMANQVYLGIGQMPAHGIPRPLAIVPMDAIVDSFMLRGADLYCAGAGEGSHPALPQQFRQWLQQNQEYGVLRRPRDFRVEFNIRVHVSFGLTGILEHNIESAPKRIQIGWSPALCGQASDLGFESLANLKKVCEKVFLTP